MADIYTVTGPIAVVKIGDQWVYCEQGTVLPEAAENIEHLLDVGLIAELEPELAAPAFPDGEPSESWTLAQLEAFASARGVDVSGTKAEKVAALKAAK